MEERNRARKVNRGRAPMLSGSPLFPSLHMFINLEALETHTLGIFMDTSSYKLVLHPTYMIDYELHFHPALVCGEWGVGLWGS